MSIAAQEMRKELHWDENQKGLVLVNLGERKFFLFPYLLSCSRLFIGDIPLDKFLSVGSFKSMEGNGSLDSGKTLFPQLSV